MTQVRVFLSLVLLTACAETGPYVDPPALTPVDTTAGYAAMSDPRAASRPPAATRRGPSVWDGGPESLLGDRRARGLGDILTVVIEIDDKAEISNSTSRSREGSEKLGLRGFFGLPQMIDRNLPDGASTANAIDVSSGSSSAGKGAVRRNEKLTLRIAATVTGVLENGYLRIEGSQELRVNNELRELIVAGFVRPEDISRRNEITYDKIASARVSYGGRGPIARAQQPRAGQNALDIILPF